jgi:hypothetical protein
LIGLPMTSTSIFARAVDGPLKSGRDKFQRRIIAISAPNGTLNERKRWVMSEGVSFVR